MCGWFYRVKCKLEINKDTLIKYKQILSEDYLSIKVIFFFCVCVCVNSLQPLFSILCNFNVAIWDNVKHL